MNILLFFLSREEYRKRRSMTIIPPGRLIPYYFRICILPFVTLPSLTNFPAVSNCLTVPVRAPFSIDISNEKLKRIKELYEEDRLGIDILCHGLNSETAFMVETTCIDLIGIKGLTNKINGKKSPGNDIYKTQGRLTIEEAASWYSGEPTEVSKEDKGLVFILNKLYRFDMTEQELFEATRGVWHNPPRNDESLKYAYAVYNNIVKEVYEIHGWIKAGTQEYFTRKIGRDSARWEFIGRKAEQSIRDKYVGKIINYDRSYGTPFVKVGNTPAGK